MKQVKDRRVSIAMVLLTLAVTGPGWSESTASEGVRFTSEHRISAGGGLVRYEATAGETLLRNEADEPIAAIWSMAYVASNQPAGNRPVVFVFSGGPGAASGSMNVGFLGPKVVHHTGTPGDDDGAAPFELMDNPHSLLDLADFVFVDPVGTGFSRAIGVGKNTDFWSMASDTASMADFIRLWITENGRWNSPKYILGLSYGTPRAVTIARRLANPPYEMALNGLMLHGPALDFIALDPIIGSPITYVSFLPTQAAIAHYHGKAGVGLPLETFVEQARRFAVEDYFAALIAGSNQTQVERQAVADRMSELVGIGSDFIMDAQLRISVARFRAELLRDTGMTVGYNDGRYAGPTSDPNAAEPQGGDPSVEVYSHRYGTAINVHLTEHLGVKMERPYKAWNVIVGRDWTWSPDLSVFTNPQAYRQAKRIGHIEVASQLAAVMRQNASFEVQVAVGYYDLYTPFFDSERVFANFGIDKKRVEMNYYPTGHRLWHNGDSRESLMADIRRFLMEGVR